MKNIGKVKLTYLDIDSRVYEDAAESRLLDIFSSKDVDTIRKKSLENNPDWPIFYHLTPIRKNVISWIDFEQGTKVLEVGSGCGAITEELVSRNINVVANDISERRSLINAHRNSKSSNLEIVIGNLENYHPTEKFDYVVCVGVLEYAGSFISSKDPYNEFIKKLRSFLTPKGTLILAIENKLGHKYLSGAREDHTGKMFDSINNYLTTPKKVKTFGRLELDRMLGKEFKTRKFYYPFPDYKLPQVIYSDSYYPGINGCYFPLQHLPTPSYDHERQSIFNEKFFMKSVEENCLYPQLSNSFIVLATNSESVISSKDFIAFQNNRTNSRKLNTYISSTNGEKRVYKLASQESISHLSALADNYKKIFFDLSLSKIELAKPISLSENLVSFDFISGENLEKKARDTLLSGDISGLIILIKTFIDRLESIPSKKLNPNANNSFKAIFGTTYNRNLSCISGLVDLNLDNFITDKNGILHHFDYEWCLDFDVPLSFIVGRMLLWFTHRHAGIFKLVCNEEDSIELLKGLRVPKEYYQAFSIYLGPKYLKELISAESAFHSHILNTKNTKLEFIYSDTPLVDIDLLQHTIKEKEEYIALLAKHIEETENSKGHRFLSKIRNVKSSITRKI